MSNFRGEVNGFGLAFSEFACEQGTPEWLDARSGRITASMIKVVRKRLADGGLSVAAKKYAFRLAFERVSKSLLDDTYNNAYMKRGNVLEEDARILHEARNNTLIEVPGIYLSECGRFGASPDGLLSSQLGAEYKCFLSPDELYPILIDGDTSTVMDQVQFCMLATSRTAWEFFLYTPQMAGVCATPYKIYPIDRDEDYIESMLSDLYEFDELIKEYMQIIIDQYMPQPPAPETTPEEPVWSGYDMAQPQQQQTNYEIQF